MIAQTASAPAVRRSAIVSAMADFITSHTASAGSVTREDLQLDFTDSEIDTHFEAAKVEARRRGKARQ